MRRGAHLGETLRRAICHDQATYRSAALAEAFAGLAGIDTRKLELKGAAAALRNMVGLARLGFKVQRVKGQAHHASRWRLENVEGEIDQELPTAEAPEFADDPLEDEKEPWEDVR